MFPRVPSRAVRYALIATHAARDAISDVEVDFTRAEQAIADRLDALTTKVDALMDKLAAYEEANEDGPDQEPKDGGEASTVRRKSDAKAKAKAKPRAKSKAKAKR